MTEPESVAAHYRRDDLLAAIERGLDALGKTPADVAPEDLAPVDEFHVGGREASERLLARLDPGAGDHVLDVGCGLGGTARLVASRHGSRVTGIDLVPGYVETGTTLCRWTGLDDRVALHLGSALEMPFGDESFDAAYAMHVGMNVPDKAALCAEVHRVLRPGAAFGIYDVMRTGDGALVFPVPWAEDATVSAVATPETYRAALERAGFSVLDETDRGDFALDFLGRLRARLAVDGPPPLGLHLLMGANAPAKIANLVENVSAGRLAPTEILARKASPA